MTAELAKQWLRPRPEDVSASVEYISPGDLEHVVDQVYLDMGGNIKPAVNPSLGLDHFLVYDAKTGQMKWVSASSVQGVTQAEGDRRWLQLQGGTLAGPLVLHADPTAGKQAATKDYVDQHAAGALSFYEIYPDASHLPATTVGHPELKPGHFVITENDGHVHVCRTITPAVTWNDIGPAGAIPGLPDGSGMPQGSVMTLDASHRPVWSPDLNTAKASLTALTKKVDGSTPTHTDFNPATPYTAGQAVMYNGKLYVAKQDTTAGQTPDSNPGKWLALDLADIALKAAHALTQNEADTLYLPLARVKVVDTLPADATGLLEETLIFVAPVPAP